MDADTIRNWLQAANMLGMFFLGAWLYLEKRGDKTNERVGHLADKVEQLAEDVVALEAAAAGAPKHADLAHIYDAVNRVARELSTLSGENRGQSDTLRMIMSLIAEKGSKKLATGLQACRSNVFWKGFASPPKTVA